MKTLAFAVQSVKPEGPDIVNRKILFLGYGYTARALARRLSGEGWSFAGTARSVEKAASLADEGVEPVLWSDEGLPNAAFESVEAILVSTPPDAQGCPALAAAADHIASRARAIGWIGYLSSNGVYGDHDGAAVDEDSTLRPSTDRARARIRAESDWASFAVAYALPLVIFRLPGIYGPGRSALDSVRQGRAQRIFKEGQVFNRMHVDDIAAALHASIENPGAGDLFNLSDDEPAPPQDVIAYACTLLGVDPPPLISIENADLSEMARSFYQDNKRVSNARMKEKLSLRLDFPTYREGLAAIMEGEKNLARA